MADKVVMVQAGKKVVNVKMETNATALADVVVTGYQTLSKERATVSYSVISEKSTKGKLQTIPTVYIGYSTLTCTSNHNGSGYK